ncbi:MAG: hypothetical protein AAF639_12010 [Chloroflexota bacterium]
MYIYLFAGFQITADRLDGDELFSETSSGTFMRPAAVRLLIFLLL